MQPLPSSVLPAGVRARILPGINGLDVHVLEAGYETPGRPAVLLSALWHFWQFFARKGLTT